MEYYIRWRVRIYPKWSITSDGGLEYILNEWSIMSDGGLEYILNEVLHQMEG